MLRKEAAWLGRQLSRLPADALSPLLSLGSGIGQFREGKQPWISDLIYRPLEQRGVSVTHHEFAPAPGVDVAGDLEDPSFLQRLATRGAGSIMCCNVLEHLENRVLITGLLPTMIKPGGYIIVTVPHRFPYHADPIDTLYRPTVRDLASELRGLDLVAGEEVKCGTLVRYLLDAPDARESVVKGVRTSFDRLRRRNGDAPDSADHGARPRGAGAASYVVRQTEIACAVFRRPMSDQDESANTAMRPV